MEFLKTVAGRIVTGLVVLGVVAGGISWWQMDASTRQTIVSGTGRLSLWGGVMLALPWASFFLIGRVAKLESNFAGAVLVVIYSLLETVLLAWLFHWRIQTPAAWTFLIFGGLIAGGYNLLTCDWIAEKLE
jgi:FtsH-binding integral membrane protein